MLSSSSSSFQPALPAAEHEPADSEDASEGSEDESEGSWSLLPWPVPYHCSAVQVSAA
jgi:hypothetical protein